MLQQRIDNCLDGFFIRRNGSVRLDDVEILVYHHKARDVVNLPVVLGFGIA